jgi:hypothetical protein
MSALAASTHRINGWEPARICDSRCRKTSAQGQVGGQVAAQLLITAKWR